MINESCPICQNKGFAYEIDVRDWEFDSNNTYQYRKCEGCGCLYRVLANFENNTIYDSKTYSTLQKKIDEHNNRFNGIMGKCVDIIKKVRNKYAYYDQYKIVGRLFATCFPVMHPYLRSYAKYFRDGKSFLDVGAGTGKIAYELREAGINAQAIEPYLASDIVYSNGLVVKKCFLDDVTDNYDIVFLSNVFEHLEEPIHSLMEIRRILNDDGICGIVIPGYGKMTEVYMENSYIIQAPQHYCIYSEKGIRKLSELTGFSIISIERKTKLDWYIKSFLLANGRSFDERMTVEELEKLISSNEKKQIYRECYGKGAETNGDWYHVILKKQMLNNKIS